MSRSSTSTGRSNSAANGSAVCCARSIGLLRSTVTSWPCNDSAAAFAIWMPNSDSRYPGSRPYRIFVGLCTSPCRSRWTTVSATSRLPGGGGQRPLDRGEGLVVDRGRYEPGFVGARRQVHAAVEHRVEERAEGGGVLPLRPGKVGDLGLGDEHREQVAGGGQAGRYP